MKETLSLALWATAMGCAPRDRAGFVELAAERIAVAARAGAELLVMPEHVAEALLTYAPAGLPETEEVAWMAAEAGAILPPLAALAREAGMALLAGTVPARVGDGGFRNRAHLFLPDGRVAVQDKLVLTPDERDPDAWMLEPGDRLEVILWRGWRIAIVICLDIEQPALAARLQALDLDLVLVPSDTALASGHARVFGCARARAVELFSVVAAVGGVGAIPLEPPRRNMSGAAVFLPCEAALGSTGVLAELSASDSAIGAGELLLAPDAPLGLVRRQRRAGGEVWAGPWSAVGVAVVEPVEPGPGAAGSGSAMR